MAVNLIIRRLVNDGRSLLQIALGQRKEKLNSNEQEIR